jgi:RHS repeat-associated protein
MEAYYTIAAAPAPSNAQYLYIALQDVGTPSLDGYQFRLHSQSGGVELRLARITDGVTTPLASTPQIPTFSGDKMLLRRVGTTIEGWVREAGVWTLRLSAANQTQHAGPGKIGVQFFQVVGPAGAMDDLGGGAIGAPPPPPPPPPSTDDPPPEQSRGICTGTGIHAIATSRCLSDPVNTLTGAFVTSVEDVSMPGTGVEFAWARTYTSSDPTGGRLGAGWTDGYATSLHVEASGDVRLRGDEGQIVAYAKQPDGSFAGAPGSLSTLKSVAGGYELLRSDQVVYRFDVSGRLLSTRDRNEQGLTFAYDAGDRLTAVTDAVGRRATLSYDAAGLVHEVATEDGRRVAYGYTAGRLTSVTDVRGKTWRYTYDSEGHLATIVDPLDHVQVTNVYGPDGRVQRQTDALGATTSFAWDASTQTATVTDAARNEWKDDYEENVLVARVDPLGNTTMFAHDADLNTSGVTSPGGDTTSMTYDARANLLSATAPASLGSAQKTFVHNTRNDPTRVTDARGVVTSYAYDADGNLEQVVQDGTPIAAYTYDAAGRVLSSTDANSNTTTYGYDASGNLASETDPVGSTTTYTYDGAGRVLTRVDPRGNTPGANPAAFTWRWTYDASGQVLTERDPTGAVTTHTYDAAGHELTTTDANGRTTTSAYDAAGRIVSETRPDPDGAGPLPAPVVTYTYDEVGNKAAQTDALGRTTTFGYDRANRLVSTTGSDPDGSGPLAAPVTTRSYDDNGNVASTVEPRGNVAGANPDAFRTRFAYDAASRLLTTTDPLGGSSANAYDAVGNVTSERDANGHTTAFTYDGAGRILTVTAPDGGVTSYTYDHAGNRLTRRDANDHVTTYAYDLAGRLVSESGPDPDGPGPQGPAVTTHTYDPNGNRASTVDPNGNVTTTAGDGRTSYAYDAANQLVAIDYSDATPDVTFSYDAVGNRLSMTDGSGTETMSYDALGRLAAVTRGPDTFSYRYDAVENLTRRTYPGGTTIDYGYDGLDRLSSVAAGGETTTYGYDAASHLTQTTLPAGSGHVETRVYDRAGRLAEIKNQRGTNILSRFLSTLDAVGNPTQVVRTGSLAETQTYTYDASDRITGVCLQTGSCPGASDAFVRWSYDKVGNRLSEQRPTGTTAYTYDARDRLLTAGSTSFAYDQNGNQTRNGTRTFTYDLTDRLRTTSHGPSTTTYSYDGEGKRLEAAGEGTAATPTLRAPCTTAIGASNTATVAKPAGTVAGDLLIVGIGFEKGTDAAITPPSGWTLIRRTNQSSDVGYATYRKAAGASEPASYAFGLTNSPKWSIGSCAISGADATTPIDVHNGAFGSSGNPSAPSVTTTGPRRLVLAFYTNKKAATFSSYTSPAVERWDRPNRPGGLPSNAMASYELPASGASGAKSAVASEQEKWVAQQIAIAPTPGVGSTRFLWDPSFGVPQLALERDENNSALRSYTYGARRISQTAGSSTSYYLYDQLGSVANVTSAFGATQWTYAYEPFGATRAETSNGGPTNFMKFTGEYLDPTGLYHLRARQYDPSSGRFIGPDPAEPNVGSPFIASYVYAADRPTVLVDPSGETFRPSDEAVDATGVPTSLTDWEMRPEPCASQTCTVRRPPRVVYPIPRRYASHLVTFRSDPIYGLHPTRNLPGYPAIDFRAVRKTPVVAVESGRIREFSSAIGGGALYFRGESGVDYFYGHITPGPISRNQRFRAGDVIARVAPIDYDHLHLGANANFGGNIVGRERVGTDDPSHPATRRATAIIKAISRAPRT